MTLSRCDCCHGRRHLVGLGGMERECSNCKGVGFVKAAAAAEPVVVVKRKRRTPAEIMLAAKENANS